MNFDLDSLWETLTSTLKDWAESAVAHLPNLVVALLLGFLFFWMARGVKKIVNKTLQRTTTEETVRHLLATLAQFAVLIAGLMVCLSVMDLGKAVTSILAGAGVLGLALGFAFQDIAANFISGVGLSIKHPFSPGDIIETNSVTGVAEQIDLRTTTLRTFDGKRVRIPNKKIYEEVLINHSDTDLRRAEVVCGVSYDEDLDQVADLVKTALMDIENRDTTREPEVFFTGFGGSSIDFRARVWFDYGKQRDLLLVQDSLVRTIKKTFDNNDIAIPFPIRTLDFGIKGGVTLEDSLQGLKRASAENSKANDAQAQGMANGRSANEAAPAR